MNSSPLDEKPHHAVTHRHRRRQGRPPDLAIPAWHRHRHHADDVLHSPTDGRPNLNASLAEPSTDVDDRGEGSDGEGELLPHAAGGTKGHDWEVDLKGHPLEAVSRGERLASKLGLGIRSSQMNLKRE
jgi:hypothetical protein